MTPEQRKNTIEAALKEAFNPDHLEIIDESRFHVGHAGASTGASHFAVEINGPAFKDKKLIEAHRMVYGVIGHLIPSEIHALRIVIK